MISQKMIINPFIITFDLNITMPKQLFLVKPLFK